MAFYNNGTLKSSITDKSCEDSPYFVLEISVWIELSIYKAIQILYFTIVETEKNNWVM